MVVLGEGDKFGYRLRRQLGRDGGIRWSEVSGRYGQSQVNALSVDHQNMILSVPDGETA